MTYIEFIKTILENQNPGIPIYIKDLADNLASEFQIPEKEAAAAVSVAVKRIRDGNIIPELRFFRKGIYYITKQTPFGEIGINKEVLIVDKYLSENNGYETGQMLLHNIGLTSLVPKNRVFATNKANESLREDKSLGVFIRPPKTRINKNNKNYLQILDVIEAMAKSPVDAEQPFMVLAKYIEKLKLDYGELLSLADKYYGKNTILGLAHVARERS